LPPTPTKQRPPQQAPPQQQVAQQPSQTAQGQARTRKVGLDDFNFLAVLGKGNFGKVMLAEEKKTNKQWAIKVLKKEFIIENDEIESTKSEKRVFLAAARERHPFLLDLHSCFQTETRIYFVCVDSSPSPVHLRMVAERIVFPARSMEYVQGGDLMLHIQREHFTPRRARFYAAEVLLALESLHKQGIVYRDLKLDNILLTLDGHVKVADYGLCKENMWYQSTTSTFCGTPEFMAPEVRRVPVLRSRAADIRRAAADARIIISIHQILLEQRYGRAVDWWAFGVLIYEMLLGQSPFRGDDEDEIFDAILEDEILYPIHMRHESVSILQQLLCRDPTRRLGAGPDDAEPIKRHSFFKDINWDDIMAKRVPAPYFPKVSGPLDTSNFDQEFTSEQPTLTPVHSQLSSQDQKEFKDFSWIGPAGMEGW
jgi:classical protein kinase C